MPHVVIEQVVNAPPQQVWDAVTDWDAQSEWVLATTVVAGPDGGQGMGGRLDAYTGVPGVSGSWRRRLAVHDPMVVVEWDPPRRCVVEHLGAVVRGRGIIEIEALPTDRSRLVWTEDVELPFGAVGRWGWPIVSRMTAWGFGRSLAKFASLVEGRARTD